jgi:hypothetical protein
LARIQNDRGGWHIPHYVVLFFLDIAALVVVIIAWFATLFTGAPPHQEIRPHQGSSAPGAFGEAHHSGRLRRMKSPAVTSALAIGRGHAHGNAGDDIREVAELGGSGGPR